jgi:maltooligosyltrehalose trehalohydrolase
MSDEIARNYERRFKKKRPPCGHATFTAQPEADSPLPACNRARFWLWPSLPERAVINRVEPPHLPMNTGATVQPDGTSFRVWAPHAQVVEVFFASDRHPTLLLTPDGDGYASGFAEGVGSGALYQYRLDGNGPYPDPRSRFQPTGPHGHSMLIDPRHFDWTDAAWPGLDPARQVYYELHVGTFTPEGTYDAAAEQLPVLRKLGVTCLELMPVAEFAGRHGWGYDGVGFFAPYHCYGNPDQLRNFVDRAHAAGLGVILDVVYNHIGDNGNYLHCFSPEYFTDEHDSGWGKTFNYALEPVRQFALDNAAYWIGEFHMDGLRLDAIQSIFDKQHPRLLESIVSAARAAAGDRSIVISAEDYLQRADLLLPADRGGAQLDLLWNDDFHHASRVAASGSRGGYFSDYRGDAQELLSTMLRGFLFQGQFDAWAERPRGVPTRSLPVSSFLVFTQNHDQIANTLNGRRLHELTSPGRSRTLHALLLLGPCTPLIFMGQEFDSSSLFPYFADGAGSAAADLWRNRRKETADFEQYAGAEAQDCILDPSAAQTVNRAVLDFSERETHAHTLRLFQDLLTLRRDDAVLSRRPQVSIDGAVLSERAFALRWNDDQGADRLLLVNPGNEIQRAAIPEPLLAPPPRRRWHLQWCSDDPRYGGMGIIQPFQSTCTHIASECAYFLIAAE